MNELSSGTGPLTSPTSDAPYQDRSNGLIAFGVLTILLGCMCGVLIGFMLLGQMISTSTVKVHQTYATMAPAILIYGLLAVVLIWLGTGSIMARRWARALMLIFSWSWLGIGLIDLVVMSFILPKTLAHLPTTGSGRAAVPAGTMTVILVVIFVIFGFLFIVLPAIWTFFYSSRHVKATCDARDPVWSWTDACPLPVLGLCLWLWATVPMLLVSMLATHGVMPFFGMFLTGIPGVLFCLLTSALWGYAAWLLYRLELQGWWLILAAVLVMMASSVLTFARHDALEMYRLMDYPPEQIAQIQQTGMFTDNSFLWLTSAWLVPVLCYLIFIKRYFPGKLRSVE